MTSKFKQWESIGNNAKTTLWLLQDCAFSGATVTSDQETIVSLSKERENDRDRKRKG